LLVVVLLDITSKTESTEKGVVQKKIFLHFLASGGGVVVVFLL
jgi:hypothetical protein